MHDDSPTLPPSSPPPELLELHTMWTTVAGEPIEACSFDSAATYKPATPSPFATSARPAERYTVVSELGRGGMGVVYRAEQPALRREVALKKIRGDVDGDALAASFLAEALTTAWLDHPNIVPVHSLEQGPDGELALAMKIVSGRPWSALLEERADDDLDRQLEILLAVCDAIAFAHSREVLHLDLKPENVMVGAFGEVLVMDWGLACSLQEPCAVPRARPRGALAGKPCGTPSYMAPELADGRAEDLCPATDVFLLGAILHELVTGRPPHRGDSLWQVIIAASRAHPPQLPDSCPVELRRIIERALARETDARFARVEDFAAALRAFRTHRESDLIARGARELFDKSRARPADDADEGLYVDLAEAVAGFAQARQLWAENPDAAAGETAARAFYARRALARGDLGLAEAQAARVDDADEARRLEEELDAARRRRAAAARAARRIRRGLVGALALVMLSVLGGLLAVRNARQSSREEQRARAVVLAESSAAVFRAARDALPEVDDALQVLPEGVREQHDRALGQGLDALAAAEALVALPGAGAAERQALATTALGLAEVARAARQWGVARSVLEKAQARAGASDELAAALAGVERARTRRTEERAARVDELLTGVQAGVDPVGLEAARYELLSLAHPRTRGQLCAVLDTLGAALRASAAEALLGAVADSARPGLRAALAAEASRLPGDTLSAGQRGAIERAERSFLMTRLRGAAPSRRVRPHELLASVQERALGEAALQLGQLCAEVLARFPPDPATLPVLWRYARAEQSELRVIPAAVALVVSGGAEGDALWQDVRRRFPSGGLLDRRLAPYLRRAGITPPLLSASTAELLERAEDRFARRDFFGARADLRAVLELDPEESWAWHTLARISASELDAPRALEEIDKAIALNDRAALPHALRGTILRSLEREDEALEAFARAIERDPLNIGAFADRALLHAERGDADEALADVERALELDAGLGFPWALRGRLLREQGRLAEALADGDQAVKVEPKLAYVYVERGKTRLALRQITAALEDAEQAVRLGPEAPDSWVLRGRARVLLRDFEGAEHDFRMAISIYPPAVEARRHLGALLVDFNAEAAVAMLDEAAALAPDDALVHVERSRAKKALGDLEGAVDDLQRALELGPQLPEPWGLLGAMRLEQDAPADAAMIFTEALQHAIDRTPWLLQRGRALLQIGRAEEAAQDYAEVVEADPTDHQAHYGLGRALARLGEVDAALESWQRAFDIQPGVAPLTARADLLRSHKRGDRGYGDLTQALALAPEDPALWARRALVLQDLERLEEAEADAEEMVARFPEDPDGYLIRGMIRKERGALEGAREDLRHMLELAPEHRYASTARGLLEQLGE